MIGRVIEAFVGAVAAFVITFVATFGIGILSVWNSHDGQAGMGGFLGGLMLGFLAAIVTFGVMMWKTNR